MDSILQILLSWQFIIFSLGIVAITSVLKTMGEYFVLNVISKKYKNSKLWGDLILPILPVILGPIVAIEITSYPYPVGLETSGARLVFGLVSGLLSGLVYRVVKAIIKNVINNKLIAIASNIAAINKEEDNILIKETS